MREINRALIASSTAPRLRAFERCMSFLCWYAPIRSATTPTRAASSKKTSPAFTPKGANRLTKIREREGSCLRNGMGVWNQGNLALTSSNSSNHGEDCQQDEPGSNRHVYLQLIRRWDGLPLAGPPHPPGVSVRVRHMTHVLGRCRGMVAADGLAEGYRVTMEPEPLSGRASPLQGVDDLAVLRAGFVSAPLHNI